ncbi:MAG: aminotransferase class V-fold PLP-dependent enzyme [Wenzhouxiangellaceae bacterium]|nr:aminotransferase class V-fold PLP-dependent enzyme [Wenzhouxiangellaceae bacterium]
MISSTTASAAGSDLFPVIDRHVWLNHAAISPWPAPVAAAMRRFVEQNCERGALDYPSWLRTEERLREHAAAFLGGRPDDVALVKNTSEGLSVIAGGLDWREGDALVCCGGDFPSNLLPWHHLVPDFVDVREAPFSLDDPEGAICAALDDSVRLLTVSSVRYDTGVRLDLARLGRACRDCGALLVVDAIQHVGALPLDVGAVEVDFVVAGSHKWLLAPEGLAIFWSRPEARDRLNPVLSGWRMWPDMFDFDRADWRVPENARRFEPGTPNMAGIHGLEAALALLLQFDAGRRAEALLARTGTLIEGLDGIAGVDVVTPAAPERRAGIVSFRLRDGRTDPDAVVRGLAGRGIHVARRGTALRLSPNFYTPEAQLTRTLEAIDELLA